MKKKLIFIFITFSLSLFVSCSDDNNTTGWWIQDWSLPLKDDPTTVASFESSKFDGIWKPKPSGQEDIGTVMYIFKKNTLQRFFVEKDLATGNMSEKISDSRTEEFMFSNTNIYVYSQVAGASWIKVKYELSPNEKTLKLGSNIELEKIEVEPWTKEDLIGSWCIDDPKSIFYTIPKYTFTEELFITTEFMSENDPYNITTEIILTDESFTGKLIFGQGKYYDAPVSTCYYYIINDTLYLSAGYYNGLKRFVDTEEPTPQ